MFFYELDNTDNEKSIEVRLNDGAVPAKVINRAVLNNRFNSIKLYRSLPNRVVEPTRHLLKPISDNKIVCITTSPSGSDAGIYCTKFICSPSEAVLKVLASLEKSVTSVSTSKHFFKWGSCSKFSCVRSGQNFWRNSTKFNGSNLICER